MSSFSRKAVFPEPGLDTSPTTGTFPVKPLPQSTGEEIVLLHYLGPHLNHARAQRYDLQGCHFYFLPVTIFCPGLPQSGQLN